MSDDNDQPMSGAELIKWREEQERQLISELLVYVPHDLEVSHEE